MEQDVNFLFELYYGDGAWEDDENENEEDYTYSTETRQLVEEYDSYERNLKSGFLPDESWEDDLPF